MKIINKKQNINKKISVITCVIPEMIHFSKNMIESGKKLQSGNNKINWYFISSKEDIKYIEGFKKLSHCEINTHPSFNHGSALNMICNFSFDDDIIVIIDCDCEFFMKNWDTVIVDNLNKYDIFSVTLSDKDYLRYGDMKRKNPCVYFMSMKVSDFKKANFDFLPYIIKNKVKIVKNAWCDTGYKINNVINKYKCMLMENKSLENGTQEWFYNNCLFAKHVKNGWRIKRRDTKLSEKI